MSTTICDERGASLTRVGKGFGDITYVICDATASVELTAPQLDRIAVAYLDFRLNGARR